MLIEPRGAGGRWCSPARAPRSGIVVLNPAPARPLPGALCELGPLLTPNAGEARELTGRATPRQAARALAARTGAPVLVTLGAAARCCSTAGGAERLPAPRVDAVDTTGAGDTLNGALAAALAGGRRCARPRRSRSPRPRCRRRAAGAREGMPRRDEVM